MINLFKEKIQLKEKDEVIKLHIIIKCYQKGFNLSEADIDLLIELNKTGYTPEFFINCIEKGYYKSEQTIRNAVAKMTGLGILTYKKRGERFVTPEFIPALDSNQVIIQYLIGNL